MNLKSILKQMNQRPIVIYPAYIQIMGSVAGGLFLSQILYWWSVKGDEFWLTAEELKKQTCLSDWEIKQAKAKIRSLGICRITVKGIPARTFYKVNVNILLSLLETLPAPHDPESSEDNTPLNPLQETEQTSLSQSSLKESSKQVWRNPPNKFGGILQTSLAESSKQVWRNPPNKEMNTEINRENNNRDLRDIPESTIEDSSGLDPEESLESDSFLPSCKTEGEGDPLREIPEPATGEEGEIFRRPPPGECFRCQRELDGVYYEVDFSEYGEVRQYCSACMGWINTSGRRWKLIRAPDNQRDLGFGKVWQKNNNPKEVNGYDFKTNIYNRGDYSSAYEQAGYG